MCSNAFSIMCDDLSILVCNVADTEGSSSRDDEVEIVGQEFVGKLYGTTGFYAISRGTFHEIPSAIFDEMPDLESFYAVDVQMKNLPTNSFKDCSKLKKIGLQKNDIAEIGNEFAVGCSSAFSIDLSSNEIKNLSPEIFKGLKSISVLNLDFNFIEIISEGVFDEMPDLSLLTLDFNKIAYIHSSAFLNNLNLNSLVLSNNFIRVVKSEWFEMKNYFERINLKGNLIEAISPKLFDSWLDSQLQIAEKLFEINLEGNVCADIHLRNVNERSAKYFLSKLRTCFESYENNFYYNSFP